MVSAQAQVVSAQGQVVSGQPQVVSTRTQIRHRAASPTSRRANSDHFSFAEPDGSDGSDGADVSTSRPSNAPGRANRYAPNQNVDALRSCSCRTSTLPMVSPPSTQTQQLLRRAWVAPYSIISSPLPRPNITRGPSIYTPKIAYNSRFLRTTRVSY